MIADQAHAEWHAGLLRVTHRGGHTRIGYRDNHVCRNRMFSREQAAQHLAALLDHAAENETVRTREINMLENALLPRFFRRETQRLDPRFIDAKHFAGFD